MDSLHPLLSCIMHQKRLDTIENGSHHECIRLSINNTQIYIYAYITPTTSLVTIVKCAFPFLSVCLFISPLALYLFTPQRNHSHIHLLTAVFLCPLSANTYGLEFLQFIIKNGDTKKKIFEATKENLVSAIAKVCDRPLTFMCAHLH
jgi:hypothetical protein